MSNFTISGTVTAVSPIKEKQGEKPWKSCKITVKESGAEHPNEVQLDYAKFGDNVKYFKAPNVGDAVNVEFTIRQRSYKESVFNSLNVWNIETTSDAPVAQSVDDDFDEALGF